MKLSWLTLSCLILALQGCIIQAPIRDKQAKSSPFRQMNFQELIHRYMEKAGTNTIEGVYTVSGVVVKKGKNLIGVVKEKTTDRKENYARVAILREKGGKDYIELSLNKDAQTSYSIIGEFKQAASGNIFVYTHYSPKGEHSSFTFSRDESGDILEGVRVDNEGGTEITYKLTYVKLKPGPDTD
ncbi:MAG: hypothetical protein JNN04_16705 [Cyclobacteriaceae bacterium]|nr:hypothetical protein [Cyclobacteriaceae bacterium]